MSAPKPLPALRPPLLPQKHLSATTPPTPAQLWVLKVSWVQHRALRSSSLPINLPHWGLVCWAPLPPLMRLDFLISFVWAPGAQLKVI